VSNEPIQRFNGRDGFPDSDGMFVLHDDHQALTTNLQAENEELKLALDETAMLRDISFLDGLKVGWNVGVHEDQEEYDRIYVSIRSQISFAKKEKEKL